MYEWIEPDEFYDEEYDEELIFSKQTYLKSFIYLNNYLKELANSRFWKKNNIHKVVTEKVTSYF